MGTDVARVDERLSEIFRLGKRWKAVCLLDEADVLLCRRISAEIERNAIVGGKELSASVCTHPLTRS